MNDAVRMYLSFIKDVSIPTIRCHFPPKMMNLATLPPKLPCLLPFETRHEQTTCRCVPPAAVVSARLSRTELLRQNDHSTATNRPAQSYQVNMQE